MKKIIYCILFITSVNVYSQDTPFSKGINLTSWFQVNSPQEIHFTRYTKNDFQDIKSLGVDVIRLPINLHSMTLGTPDYVLDPLFLSMLDQVVDWCEELSIRLILDNHTFDPAINTEPTVYSVLKPVWQNMAEHFKDRSELLYYEILNEPHGIADNVWNIIQQAVVNDIRQIDTVHTIIVGPANWNSYYNLDQMPVYNDDNLIYTFHFYDPFLFTHQGASWTDPSMVSLSDVPFPYNAGNMPAVPADLKGTWIESSLNNYNNDGTVAKVKELIDIAVRFKNERNVPLLCGEFGVLDHNAPVDDRVEWYGIVREYLEENGITWTIWDYHGGFGVFEKFSNGMFDHDLNVPLLLALGFNVPPQSEFVVQPDSSQIVLYNDFIGTSIVSSSNSDGVLNFYSTDSKIGNSSIKWVSPEQYNQIGFNFIPIKDISYLFANNFVIGFWIKSDNLEARFDIRFVDTKDHELDHPWRMGYRFNNSTITFTGDWQYVEIPLTSFEELGSWDNAWYEPKGAFNWKKVDRFEIVDEHGTLTNTTLLFDEIKIYDPAVTGVKQDIAPDDFYLSQNYPNPFNPSTTIYFNLPFSNNVADANFASATNVRIVIYDMLGKEVATLVDKKQFPGQYSIKFDASELSSGVYYYQLITDNYFETKKMILLK